MENIVPYPNLKYLSSYYGPYFTTQNIDQNYKEISSEGIAIKTLKNVPPSAPVSITKG